MIKPYIITIAVLISFGGGMFANYKLTKTPVCNCPQVPPCPPAIKVQSLDLNSVKKIKGPLTFAPVYNGDVYMINGSDTTNIK